MTQVYALSLLLVVLFAGSVVLLAAGLQRFGIFNKWVAVQAIFVLVHLALLAAMLMNLALWGVLKDLSEEEVSAFRYIWPSIFLFFAQYPFYKWPATPEQRAERTRRETLQGSSGKLSAH